VREPTALADGSDQGALRHPGSCVYEIAGAFGHYAVPAQTVKGALDGPGESFRRESAHYVARLPKRRGISGADICRRLIAGGTMRP
jgi:hypothetical protein